MHHIFSFLQESAHRWPDKTYLEDHAVEYTYSDICRKANAIAGAICASDTRKGDRILLYADNSAEYVAALFGIVRAGCIAVPLNKYLSVDTIRFIIRDTAPLLILTNELFRKRLIGAAVCIDERNIIRIDEIWNKNQEPGKFYEAEDHPALILYTSGTAGLPKGVTLTHRNLNANTESILSYLELTEFDSLLAIVNFSYSYGNSLLLTHTKAGGKIIIENRVSYPIVVIEELKKSKASGFSTVGSYINLLLKQEDFKGSCLQHLRYITFAGESTSIEDIKKLSQIAPHLKIFVMYGQTEASARLSCLEPELVLQKAGSIGKGIPGVTLRVVREDGTDAPAGEMGEIIASGENVMKGYWNNEADTRAAIRNGWLYTGDLAVTDEEGYIYVKGRKDDIIKHLGHRISPTEIEAAINCCQMVLESAVIGLTNGDTTQIKAFVVPKSGLIDEQAILAFTRRLLPAFKRPHSVEFVGSLPKTATGKIIRSRLRETIGQSCEAVSEDRGREINVRDRRYCI